MGLPRGHLAWIWLVVTTVLACLLILVPRKWLLPAAQSLLVWPVLVADLRDRKTGDAVRHMLFWALLTSVCTIEWTLHAPAAAERSIWRASAYREEMFRYIRTGIGAEGSPRLFLPQHVLHYLGTLLLSGLSLGLAGLALGALLLDYMNIYVGALIREGARPFPGALFGWPVWAILRVVAFILGAIATASFGLGWIRRRSEPPPASTRKLLYWSFAFFLLDLVIKWTVAPHWRRILQRALDR